MTTKKRVKEPLPLKRGQKPPSIEYVHFYLDLVIEALEGLEMQPGERYSVEHIANWLVRAGIVYEGDEEWRVQRLASAGTTALLLLSLSLVSTYYNFSINFETGTVVYGGKDKYKPYQGDIFGDFF